MSDARARPAAAAFGAVMVLAALLPVPTVRAADPVDGVRDQLSRERGIAPTDLQLVYERPLVSGAVDGQAWAGKYLDLRTGEIVTGYRSVSGRAGPVTVLRDAVAGAAAARPVLERKADAPLVQAVTARPAARLAVAVWLDVDPSVAESAVRSAHPEVEWLAGRPLAQTIDQARALRAELWDARRVVYADAAAALGAEVTALGGSVGYVSTSAPLVFVDVPASRVAELAGRPDVMSMGLEGAWRTTMTSAGPTVGANWTTGSGDQGNGTRVAVVEYHNAANTGDLAGQVVQRHSTTGDIVTNIHPTWVAGAIGSRNSTWRGVAPGADIVSSGTGGYSASLATDRAIIEAADWSISPSGGDADIVNASIGQDTSTGAEEARRYFDSIGWEAGRLVVAASGNFSTFGHWDVVSPGTGYNVLTVGGVNDRGTSGTGDDLLWFVSGSDGASYRDPTSASWNQHGDYNTPNLSAPAVNVRTANGTTGSGTSIASPIVAGIAAQLVARAPTLASWPEATRAILTAGALRRTPLSGSGTSTGHEGSGTASALWSNRVLDNGVWGGWTLGSLDSGGDTA
ncbi:MAG: S8 family serine peptidase, partial [Candidatus Limnocylindria bacterium]